MKILVFDDSTIQQAAAVSQLVGHDVTLVETYDEASHVLTRPTEWMRNDRFREFDVVMTDLMVPPPDRWVGSHQGKEFGSELVPLGIFIAIKALGAGVKKVALITDGNHHDHPATEVVDDAKGFVTGSVKFICTTKLLKHGLDSRVRGVTVKDWARALEVLLE